MTWRQVQSGIRAKIINLQGLPLANPFPQHGCPSYRFQGLHPLTTVSLWGFHPKYQKRPRPLLGTCGVGIGGHYPGLAGEESVTSLHGSTCVQSKTFCMERRSEGDWSSCSTSSDGSAV